MTEQDPDRKNGSSDGTGNGGAGSGGTGNAGTGNAGTGNAGTGNAGTGNAGTGNAGTGNAGTGNGGTGNAGAGNGGTGNAGAGNGGTGDGGSARGATGDSGAGPGDAGDGGAGRGDAGRGDGSRGGGRRDGGAGGGRPGGDRRGAGRDDRGRGGASGGGRPDRPGTTRSGGDRRAPGRDDGTRGGDRRPDRRDDQPGAGGDRRRSGDRRDATGRPDDRAADPHRDRSDPGHAASGRPSHDRSGGDVARGPDRGDRGQRRTDRDGDRGGRSGGRSGPGPRNAGPPRGRVGPGRPPAVDPARQAAYDLLTAVRERDAYANLALPSILRRHRLRDRDAALATELGYGTLRAQGLLDAVIDACTDRPLSKIEHPLLDALRLGAYQLLRTRVPPHAAVDTCVELVRGEAGSRSAGFVNAVLRRIGESDEAAWLDRLAPDPAEDPVGSAALRHAHPAWIARAFADALGSTGEELTAALAADDTRPVVHLLARPGDISAEELALTTGGEPAPYSPYGVHLDPGSGDVGELDPVAEGMALVQDEGSQLAALALTRAELTGPDGGRWLDLCAGPGGKSVLLGGIAQLSGATLDAVEVAEHRAELVRTAVDDLPVTVHVADGRAAPLPDAAYDRVLVDAPCTGLGALRRRPEARWRRAPEDVTALTTLQRELLLAGLRHVRPGGVVAYVTCSPHLSETVGVLARVLRRGTPLAAVERLDTRAAMPGNLPATGDGPTVQLWPHRHGTDAMFVALLRRPLEE